jgi:antitoxin component YwqK of YwqJK toxin-antitoxin module
VTLSSLGKSAPPPSPPSPFKNVEVKDINGDGVPDLWIYYNPLKPGEIMRQEESTKGDGRVDTWSYFKDGRLIRRDVDSKGAGRPDTIFYYDNDTIVREERDEFGQGQMTYRANYQNGRLARVEKDTRGNGQPDLWIYYDATRDGEIVMKEERDLNGDGSIDLWSYYDNGRLTRRDVSAAGLEILSKQEQLPAPSAEIIRTSNSGS